MIKQAAVVLMSLFPFVAATSAALLAWGTVLTLPALWRLIPLSLVWIVVFAAGTRVFWEVVERLASKPA
jgi:hypothetical protein